MHIVHGTWIPDSPGEFVQRGAFYLWVETDTPTNPAGHEESAVHPRHLTNAALDLFLTERLGMPPPPPSARTRSLSTCSFLLPSAAGIPLPSFELLPYVIETTPAEFELAWWQVCCYRVPSIISTLNDIHFVALHAAEEFQLGSDVLFWYQWTQTLKAIITRDQYIPALKYRQLAPGPGKRGQKTADRFELYPAWELGSETYEAAIPRYVAAMPAVCAAGSNTPDGVGLFDREALLRHFSECTLKDVVTGTAFPARFDQQIAGSLLSECLHASGPVSGSRTPAEQLEKYRQWAVWRETLTGALTAAQLTLCFRLEEAPATDANAWQVHFLVASKADPFFQVEPGRLLAVQAVGEGRRAAPLRPGF